MKCLVPLGLFCFLYAFPFKLNAQQDTAVTSIQNLKWMVGDWAFQTKRGKVYESWEAVNGHTLRGKSFVINAKGDTMILETMQIVQEGNVIQYNVKTRKNKAPVPFTLVKVQEKEAVFENPAHDFPNRIIYALKPDQTLYARIEGDKKKKVRKQEFQFEQVK